MLTVSDRWWELLCPMVGKNQMQKVKRQKNRAFLIYTGRSYTPVDHILSINKEYVSELGLIIDLVRSQTCLKFCGPWYFHRSMYFDQSIEIALGLRAFSTESLHNSKYCVFNGRVGKKCNPHCVRVTH